MARNTFSWISTTDQVYGLPVSSVSWDPLLILRSGSCNHIISKEGYGGQQIGYMNTVQAMIQVMWSTYSVGRTCINLILLLASHCIFKWTHKLNNLNTLIWSVGLFLTSRITIFGSYHSIKVISHHYKYRKWLGKFWYIHLSDISN